MENEVDVVLLDFTKAFDKVAHQRIATTLDVWQISNVTITTHM